MIENQFNFSGQGMEEIIASQMETVFSKNLNPSKSKSPEADFEKLLKEKIQQARTPEVLVRGVIETVLKKEFGPTMAGQPYFEKMVASIAGAMMSNSEVKNRLIKMAVKYMDGGASSKKS